MTRDKLLTHASLIIGGDVVVCREDFEALQDRIVTALSAARKEAATSMRDKCVEKVRALRDKFQQAADSSSLPNDLTASRDAAVAAALTRLLTDIESLTLDQVKPGEM